MEIINLFPVTLLKKQASNHEVIKKYMLDMVYDDFVKFGPNDKIQGTYTDYVNGATMVHWPYLYQLYQKDVEDFLKELGFKETDKWDISLKGWYNFSTSNSPMMHDHMGGPNVINFAIVHYVVLDDTANGTFFQNPNLKLIKASSPTKDLTFLPTYFQSHFECPDVSEGDIVMFPAWLDHSPGVHNGSLRAVNALNVSVKIKDNRNGL